MALKYRPRTWSDITGQKAVRAVLRAMVKQGKVPQAVLLTGPRGTGKTTTGRILAAALNCEAEEKPCGECPQCESIFAGTSLTVIEQDAASSGLVDDVRALKEQLLYATPGEYHVVLLDEAHSMSKSAFNALLKVLEEPPPNVVFVLLTTDPGQILGTVRSRCMEFQCTRISNADIVGRLQHICDAEGIGVEPDLLVALAERADGGLRDAVMTLDQVTSVGVKTYAQLQVLMGEKDFAPTIFNALLGGDLATAYATVDDQLSRSGDAAVVSGELIRCLRDVLVVQSRGAITAQGEALEARRALAAKVETRVVFAACKVLWDLKTKYKSSDDPRSALDLAVAMLSEVVRPQAAAAPVAQAASNAGARLSLTDMQRS